MAVSFVAATTAHGANPTLPTGTLATDFLVLTIGNHLETGGPHTFTFSAPGYTSLTQDSQGYSGPGDARTLGLAFLTAPGSAGAPSITASHGGFVAVLAAYRGVNLASPVTGPGALLGPISGAADRLIPSPGSARTGSAIVGGLMVGDNTGAATWGGNPPNEPPGFSAGSIQEVTGANSSIHQGYRAGIEGGDTQLWVIGSVTFEPEPPVVELEFRVNWGVVDRGIARSLLLRPA